MSSVNLFTREISLKVVYYGPGLGGKTSSLQFIHRALKTDSRGQLVSLATGVDRTLYFDFLPVKLPKLRGYSIRVQLYTVPGQVHYNSTRKLVLAGCDGVMFVADSQRDRETANVESYENLRENLAEQGMRLDQIPHVLEFNKRDAPSVLTVAEMNAKLNPFNAPVFETVATTGVGIFEALKSITALVLNDLRRRGIWDGGTGSSTGGDEKKPATNPAEFQRTETSIAERIQALSESVDASTASASATQPEPLGGDMFRSSTPAQGVPQRIPSGNTGSIANGQSSGGNSGLHSVGSKSYGSMITPLPTARIPRAEGLSELLPFGPTRDAVANLEAEIQRADYAKAVQIAAHSFGEAAKVESTSGEIAPVLHALMIGLGGKRYLRFCEAADRAEQGNASLEDALFALFFLVDATLER